MNPAKNKSLIPILSLLLLLSLTPTLPAQNLPIQRSLRTSALISDNMVLQQGKKVPLWGWANPGEKISVTLNNKTATATTDPGSRWRLKLGPFKPGGPYEMRINGDSSDSSKTISNVLVGEVWICSGQSNMEMPVGGPFGGAPTGVKNSAEEIASANYPQIRMFRVEKALAREPLADVKGSWLICSPDTATSFSAVGYFFARDIHKNRNAPVGMINTAWSGATAEPFISRATLEKNPEFRPLLEKMEKTIQDYPAKFDFYLARLRNWEKSAEKTESEGLAPLPMLEIAPPRDPRFDYHLATRIYNGMIAPSISYGIKGAIWYQGESNASDPQLYYSLFPALIREWREKSGQGDFPFLYVQLANFGGGKRWAPDSWAFIREAQLRALELPNTAMAVAADIGESKSIHPLNKQEVGRRLALAALAKAYGKKAVYSGPIYDSMKVEGNKVRLKFKHTEGGLVVKSADIPGNQSYGKTPSAFPLLGERGRGEGARSANGSPTLSSAEGNTGDLSADDPLQTFTIAGADQQFVPAQAKIEGKTVVVWSDSIAAPIAARYAWSNDPVGCNLYNQAGLPASPFRTDH